jgi:hypothetical protein
LSSTVLIASAVVVAACAPAFWQGMAQGLGASSSGKIMVFGGAGHRTYLGCH